MCNSDEQYVVRCRDLHVDYGADPVLSGVDLTVPNGVLLPFVGPNGAGKTTLLRTFLGLVKHSLGTIDCRWGGTPPGYVPQQKTLDPLFPISVMQIIEMGLYPERGMWGRKSREQTARVTQILEQFQLHGHEQKTFAELSGGMRQKTLIARALVSGADVLVLDEPTAGLDARTEHEVIMLLRELNQSMNKTVLLAHHRLEDLSVLSDRVCFVDRQGATIIPAGEACRQLRFVDEGGASC